MFSLPLDPEWEYVPNIHSWGEENFFVVGYCYVVFAADYDL